MTSDGAAQADTFSKRAQGATLRLTTEADTSGQGTKKWPSRSEARAMLYELLQGKAGEVEARCRNSKAWWMQGALRWKAIVRQGLPTSRPHEESNGNGDNDARRDPRQRRNSTDESPPPVHAPVLSCMNEFVLLRRVYGRGHLARVTSALALTASLLPVAMKTYVVRALKRGRTAIFGADGMHMTNEYEKVRREIAVQSSLRHPNICPLYGVINDIETGCLHLVLQLLPYPLMEWVEELQAYTARPLYAGHRREMQLSSAGDSHVLVYTEDAVRRILRQVLGALDYLHSLNIVHKDIKPQNILSAAPPSPGELILAPLPHPQASRGDPSERGVSSLEDPRRGDGGCEREMPWSIARSQEEQEGAGPPRDEDGRDRGIRLDCLLEERAVSLHESIRPSGGADVDVSDRGRQRLDQPAVNSKFEGTPEEALDWRESPSSEVTSFYETDSDEEDGECDCGPQCRCTPVAELPESPALRTALAVVHKRLGPYAAYACHVRSATERSAHSNRTTSYKPWTDVRTRNCYAADEQTSACAAAGARLHSSIDPNRSQNSTICSSAQQPGNNVGSGAVAVAAARPLKLGTYESHSVTQGDGAQRKITPRKPLSTTGEDLSERCFPTASAPVLRGRSSSVETHSNISAAAPQVVDEADAETGDSLVRLARRIIMRRKIEGRLRPLHEVLFEGEADIFSLQEKDDIVDDQPVGRDAGEQGCLSRTAAFWEDAQLTSTGDGLADTQMKVTPLLAQEDCHQTYEGVAGGPHVGKESPVVRSTQNRKRSRQRSESPDTSQDGHPVAESGTPPVSQIAQEAKDSLNHMNSVSSPSVGLVNGAWHSQFISATNCNQMTDASVSVAGCACWKLADFSSACVADDEMLTVWDSEGTRHFTPPECLGVSCEEGWAGRPRDLWSVGVLLYCMFFGIPPFRGDSGLELSISIMNDTLTFPCHRALSDSAKDILKKLLCKDPRKRLTSEQLRRHPWLSATANESPERL